MHFSLESRKESAMIDSGPQSLRERIRAAFGDRATAGAPDLGPLPGIAYLRAWERGEVGPRERDFHLPHPALIRGQCQTFDRRAEVAVWQRGVSDNPPIYSCV